MSGGTPRLTYRKALQCVGHEIAPDSHPEDAEMIVAGYSLCYPCGNTYLSMLLDGDPSWQQPGAILNGFRHGVIEVAP